jgi:Zn-dependent alcohol dehydrogenase
VPKLVDSYLAGDLPIEHFITHQLEGVDNINTAMNIMLEKNCLRAVVKY